MSASLATRTPTLDAYAALLAHAELELELAGRGELDGLQALAPRWDLLTRELPASPPREAATLLQRALLIHERTHVELLRLRDAVLADAGSASRARRTAAGYAGQLAARPRLEHSA